jgi:hypothetical protein
MKDRQTRGGVEVTEHPETPRIAYGDRRAEPRADDPNPQLSLPAPTGHRHVRPDTYRRLIVALVISGSGLLLWVAFRTTHAWLVAQPLYQLPFDQIEITPPPEWIRGGRQAFLKSVQERAGISKPLPLLDLEKEQVKAIFLGSPWVENVLVSHPPLGLSVELQYREPVAWVQVDGEKAPDFYYLIDRNATILPRSDVDPEWLKRRGPLVVIRGNGLLSPLDPRPGTIWKPKAGVGDIVEGNLRIPSAAKLAGFLADKVRSDGSSLPPALQICQMDPTDPRGRGLFLWNGEDTWILWGGAPGDESPGELVAEEKWAMLRSWSERTADRRLPMADCWEITKGGVVQVPPRARTSHPSKN